MRAESSAACNILRILQDRQIPPPPAPPPTLPDPGTTSLLPHHRQMSLAVGISPRATVSLGTSLSEGSTPDNNRLMTACQLPVSGSRGVGQNVMFLT